MVTQGTLPGPLRFLLYVNDLPDSFSPKVCLFAGDCQIYCVPHSVEDQLALYEDRKRLDQWYASLSIESIDLISGKW